MQELLVEDLLIPPYQRPFSWRPETVLQLLTDLQEAAGSAVPDRPNGGTEQTGYVLGSTILFRDEGTDEVHVVDGQQRLLTLTMLLDLLDEADTLGASAPHAHHEPNEPSGSAELLEDARSPVVLVRNALHRQVSRIKDPSKLAEYIRTKCTLIRVETDDPDEAFRVFDSQNYRGKSLLPHDILKAYHLRHMHRESAAMKAALVEDWEAVSEDELDRLFATYLWRIRRWTRGLSADPAFSSRNVGEFKGLTAKGSRTPSGRYHIAAQAAVPMLALYGDQSAEALRAQQRSRFQLDAPVVAGGPFFEMVSFMLDELRRLRIEGYPPESVNEGHLTAWEKYASTRREDFSEISSMARYRYVSELYLAALLYYTNRFGDSDLEEAKDRLFSWAYTLRTKFQRVQFATVNNHARTTEPGMSAFVVLRNADSANELRHLTISPAVQDRVQDLHFEAGLVELLQGLDT